MKRQNVMIETSEKWIGGIGLRSSAGTWGLRHARPDPTWAGAMLPFEGYADYMQTPEFEQSLDQLLQLSNQE